MTQNIEIVFSFDTTGSMYPCLSEVRRKITEISTSLFRDIPYLKIGIIAHGDYCDSSIYVTKTLNLTSDIIGVEYFVKNVERTHGGDAPECYELVLREAQSLNWGHESKKLLVMIGDEVPHHKDRNPLKIDYKEEIKKLVSAGIVVHGVQCLRNSRATSFYQELASKTGGIHIPLSQFSDAVETIKAIAYSQQSSEALQVFEESLVSQKKMTRSLDTIFNALSRRDPKTGRFRKVDSRAAELGRFQVISVDEDTPIKTLVQSTGATFKTGRGYYEFTKREKIQKYKEIIIMNNETGDMYEGDAAREILDIPIGEDINITPSHGKEYTVFVQSTSNNRKLIGGTRFLYETDEVS